MTPDVVRSFARKINRQRLRPRIWDYSYLMLRKHLDVFRRFAGLLPPQGLRILDVGCGFKPWQPLVPEGTQYFGVDYSPVWSSADALASGDALPFPDNSFDAIICSEVLEHTRYPEAVIRELRRVCRPGGLMYVTSPFAFVEHGAPYDFQRLTRYFYRDVFADDELVEFSETNSMVSTGLACINMAVESGPLFMANGFKHTLYALHNLAGLAADGAITAFAMLLPRRYRRHLGFLYTMPLGYAMIVRVRK